MLFLDDFLTLERFIAVNYLLFFALNLSELVLKLINKNI